jgi:hypothetical protein
MRKATSVTLAMTMLFTVSCRSKTKEIASTTVASLTVAVSNAEGVLRHGSNELWVTFEDASGEPIDVGTLSMNFYMPGTPTTRVINNAASVTKTETVGTYHVKTKIDMGGQWQVHIAFEGPAGMGRGSFPINAE